MRAFLDEYRYRIELHAHTSPVSACGELSPEEVVDHYHALGADALVITHHFHSSFFKRGAKEEMLSLYIDDYLRAKRRAQRYGMQVILGMEIRFTENSNDYLVYGIDEEDLSRACDFLTLGIDAFYRGFKNERNVILQAHPFRDNMASVNPSSLDGIEVFNMHIGHNSRVARAAEYTNEHPEFLVSGGTDFHHGYQTTPCFMRSKTLPKTSFDIANALKSKDVLFDIAGNIVLPNPRK